MSSVLLSSQDAVEIPVIEPNGTYAFPVECDGVRVKVDWTSKQQGLICDLDLNTFFYDERARFFEKVDSQCRRSKDESCVLIKDDSESNRTRNEFLKIDFQRISPETSAIVLFLDGGPRNFQYLQSVSMDCTRVFAERHYNSFLPQEVEEGNKNGPLFQCSTRTKKSYKGMVMSVFYKDGWDNEANRPVWVMRLFLEPVYVSSIKDKQERCTQMVIQAVPALEKFRPRLFSSIRDICAALSSHSLPKLKKKFQRSEEGLHIGQFSEVIFKQLYETHPRIIEDSEAPYAVAMLQEMFQQIDYNGDGSTNWDEFTTFCVQTGLTTSARNGQVNSNGEAGFSLEQYVIEYGEEMLQRDHVLSAYRFVTQMRYVPETRKLLLIPEDSDNIIILDERFRMHTQLYPSKVQVIGSVSKRIENPDEKKDKKKKQANGPLGAAAPRALVYDVVYCSGRDLYAYTSSDHSITICKELSSVNGMKVNFLQHNRFYHNLLHLKLCWSEKQDLLCSTASDRVIYGWNIDTSQIVFQISRHSDIITDFISVDALDVFITCSMDKRIVLWSSVSRRVKGVLLGHKRGVRSLSVYENTLLSAGFECDAKVWDLVNKDCIALLKGHRHPIVAAKLMCDKATTEREHRAITVDESGEFRLWNIFVRERASEPVPVPTIQIFEMQNPESPLNQFRFLAMPFNPRASTSYYSDLIACSTKLLHFVPEKNTKEFIPPTAFCCHEAGAAMITAIGKSVLTYNLATGEFDQIFENVAPHDVFAVCMDGDRGRRMYLGTSTGELLLVNSNTGNLIDKVHYHGREITSIIQRRGVRTALFSASMDGHIHVYEESMGKIHLQTTVDSVFGEGIGLSLLKAAPAIQAVIAVSAGRRWGVVNDTTYKKLLIVHETDIITAVEVIGTSRDRVEEDLNRNQPLGQALKESILTLAVAMAKSIAVYAFDTQDLKGCKTFELVYDHPIYITSMLVMKAGDGHAVNYSSIRSAGSAYEKGSQQLIATTDDGKLVVWHLGHMWASSEEKFRNHYKHVASRQQKKRGGKTKASVTEVADNLHRAKSAAPPSAAASPAPLFLTGVDLMLSEEEAAIQSAATMFGSPSSPKGNSRASALNSNTSWLETTSKDMFPTAHVPKNVPPPLEAKKGKRVSICASSPLGVTTDKAWAAHADMIPGAVALASHGCFVTVSHDGYHRIWNLDAECLGEMVLPNITDVMKQQAMCKEPGSQWRFILERIPITKHHVEIASVLVRSIKQSRQDRLLEQQMSSERSRHLFPLGFKGFRESQDDELDGKDHLRKTVLLSLHETPKFSDDPPPTRLPTKEEKELIKLAFGVTARPSITAASTTSITVADPMRSQLSLTEKSITTTLKALQRQNTPKSKPATPLDTQESSLRSSLLFNGDSSVCLSAFGVPSLWYVPGEKDIFGKSVCVNKDAPQITIPAAFSESSVASLHREGLIDAEGHRILRAIASKSDRVHVYDRSQPTLLIRNPTMSSSVTLPALDSVRRTEIAFGTQKDMYKNAEKLLNDKDSMPKSAIRNAVAMARVEASVRKINSMVHLIQPPTHDEVILPKASTNGDGDDDAPGGIHRTEEARMQLRLLRSSAQVPMDAIQRPLDRTSLDKWVSKMSAALDGAEKPMSRHEAYKHKKKKKKEVLSQAAVHALEHKLYVAIRGEFRNRMAIMQRRKQAVVTQAQRAMTPLESQEEHDRRMETAVNVLGSLAGGPPSPTPPPPELARADSTNELEEGDMAAIVAAAAVPGARPPSPGAGAAPNAGAPAAGQPPGSPQRRQSLLTTRMLLPYYKLEAVHQFMDIFAKVDENFSGDLDVNEWIRLFTSLNESVPVQEARMIFMKIDKDGDGYLSMRELIPVVFNKASREQQRLIINYAEMELTKKVVTETVPKITPTDLEFLFEAYDMDNVGFVDIAYIKERIKNLGLSEQQLYFFMELIAEMADDDMVNSTEFKRVFKPFTATNTRVAAGSK